MVVQQQDAIDQVDQQDALDDQVEGLGEDDAPAWGDYPLDDILVKPAPCTIRDALFKIRRGSYVMDPEFQRDFIWPVDKQSKLIESVLMRIPLPVFYLAEDHEGRMVVVDGLQRLSTFQKFADNELTLQLRDRPDLDRKKLSDLPPKLQNRFEDCGLILYVLDEKAPDRARLDIFERVNGGVALTHQQMRNCMYMGAATGFLKEEANTNLFREATGKSLNTRTMRDREFVNRFCAFEVVGIEGYGDMDDFLAESLRRMNAHPEMLPGLSARFRISMENNLDVFGRHAFRKHTPDQGYRNMINAALWDVMSIGLARYSPDVVRERKEALRSAFYRLMDDGGFQHAITYSTNAVRQVKYRFAATREMFAEVFDA